jgi:hypothetical protein
MTRISLISVEYCSLETPARSAAPYAHQWHTNPNIFGLNSRSVLIRWNLLCQYSRLRYLFAIKDNFFGHKHFTRSATRCSILDPGCWIAAVFYLFFIQLKGVENNGYYLNKLWNKAACGFSSASIEHPESSIMYVQLSYKPLSHKGSPRLFDD